MSNTTGKADPSERQVNDAILRLKNKLAGAGLANIAMSFSPTNKTDVRLLIVVVEGQQSELRQIDMILARRDALDDLATRSQKIQKAIDVASAADSRQRHLMDVYKALDVNWGSDVFGRITDLKKYHPSERYVSADEEINRDRLTESIKGHTFKDAEQRERFLDKERLCKCGHTKGSHYNFTEMCIDSCDCLSFRAAETPTEPRDVDSRTKPNQRPGIASILPPREP